MRASLRGREKTMTMLRTILCAAMLVMLSAWPAYAQRELTTTTLNANLAVADDTMTVTSSTGFVVGQLVLIDYEVVRIQNLNGTAGTSTLISIQRGVDGTVARAHDNAKVIWVSTQNNDFKQVDPDWSADCTRGTGEAAVLPWPNSRTGTIWDCLPNNSRWQGTNAAPITWDSIRTSSP